MNARRQRGNQLYERRQRGCCNHWSDVFSFSSIQHIPWQRRDMSTSSEYRRLKQLNPDQTCVIYASAKWLEDTLEKAPISLTTLAQTS